jgi:predicted glycosyltransferase involved in capsule biosynthesis
MADTAMSYESDFLKARVQHLLDEEQNAEASLVKLTNTLQHMTKTLASLQFSDFGLFQTLKQATDNLESVDHQLEQFRNSLQARMHTL